MYIKRKLSEFLKKCAKNFPVVTLTGPRQSGKTTLLREVFKDKDYVSFENPDNRELFRTDPRGFLKRYEKGAIFDEFQLVPELPSYLQQIVDERKENGLYILSGSQQLEIMSQVSQSLAGRTAVLKLFPFTISEISSAKSMTEDQLMIKGFYPSLYEKKIEPRLMYQSYFDTYVQRDLHQLISVNNLDVFQRFVRLCAGRVGQVFVASQLSNALGVSVPTIQSWLSILQASYIVYLLPPYYKNFNKRITKSPKLYFYDVGFASYLLNLESEDQLSRDPLRGHLYENMVVMDILKMLFHKGKAPNLYFYRDRNQNEVDLLWEKGSEVILLEIKSSSTFHSSYLKSINYLKKLSSLPIENSYLVYSGQDQHTVHDVILCSYKNLLTIFE